MNTSEPVTREDIEAKLGEFKASLEGEGVSNTVRALLASLTAAAAAVPVISLLAKRRRSRPRTDNDQPAETEQPTVHTTHMPPGGRVIIIHEPEPQSASDR